MVVEQLNEKILAHELQLGERLNECVHQKRRSDFSLMLAMLNDDVREHSQFSLPQSKQPEPECSDEMLRKQFSLPKKVTLSLTNLAEIERFNQAQLVEENRLSDIKLAEALNPNVIAFRDDKSHIDSEVISNTSLHCQKHYHQGETQQSARKSFDAINWLNAVQTTIVKSSLLTA